ncbi:MAG: DUF2461 domain-containing protein [Bacteroidota bacterium]|nr:DUF2461 domain-containing protein [Bacteroidota bacterium]
MKKAIIPKSTFAFLTALSKNNNRDWFNQNKETYLNEYEHMIAFTEALQSKMALHDHIELNPGKKTLFRIYADIRFSKDKAPYKNHWSGRFKRATKKLRGGYYFHIQPGNTFVAGGFFAPNPDDLKRIRQDIELNEKDWRKMLSNKTFVKTFNTLQGEKVLSAPKGFSKEHSAIDLLRHKQFIIKHAFTDKEVIAPDFLNLINDTFKKMRPFFDYMSEVLTTDLNGVSVV